MVKHDFHETPNMYPNLSLQQQFRLNKINEIKYYFVAEIKERELTTKRLSKYIGLFDYFDKSIIFHASFVTVTGAPVGIVSASFSVAFSISTGIVKKLLKTTRNKKKKHNKAVMLAKSKFNSIESKISEALINNEISNEDLMTIINEKIKYRELKESIRMMNSQGIDVEKINLVEEGKK